MTYRYLLILAVVAAFAAVVSAGRLFKRPLMEGHSWRMPKAADHKAHRVHVDDVEDFTQWANEFMDNSLTDMPQTTTRWFPNLLTCSNKYMMTLKAKVFHSI